MPVVDKRPFYLVEKLIGTKHEENQIIIFPQTSNGNEPKL